MEVVQHMMLIDDDEDDREIFLSVLKLISPQARCVIATNGEDALEKLRVSDETPQLIFLDLNMPLMNGKQFLREIRRHEKLSTIPVVILSTSSDQTTIDEAIRLGAVDFITKPDKYSAWDPALKKVLNNFLSLL